MVRIVGCQQREERDDITMSTAREVGQVLVEGVMWLARGNNNNQAVLLRCCLRDVRGEAGVLVELWKNREPPALFPTPDER